jgi:hypothetical protein
MNDYFCEACLIITGLMKKENYCFQTFLSKNVHNRKIDLKHFIISLHDTIGHSVTHRDLPSWFRDDSFFRVVSAFIGIRATQEEFKLLLDANPGYISEGYWIMCRKTSIPEGEPPLEEGVVRFVHSSARSLRYHLLSFAIEERNINLTRVLIDLGFWKDKELVRDRDHSKNPCKQLVLEERRKREKIEGDIEVASSLMDDLQISQTSVGGLSTLLDDMNMEF